jgi:hypothetical protein
MRKSLSIPLDIGEWEQDTNCLSTKAVGAWLKIVFKCWKHKGIFITNVDSVCRLWKVDRLEYASIVHELKSNDLGNIEERVDDSVVFIFPPATNNLASVPLNTARHA